MSLEDKLKDTGLFGEVFLSHIHSYYVYEKKETLQYANHELKMIKHLYPKHYSTAKQLYDECNNIKYTRK